MTLDRRAIEDVWDRFLARESITAVEEQVLFQALSRDPGLRAELLEDERTHGALAALGRSEADGEEFVAGFDAWLAAERDASRFVKKVEVGLSHQRKTARAGRGLSDSSRTALSRSRKPAFPRWAWGAVAAAALIVVVLAVALRPSARPASGTASRKVAVPEERPIAREEIKREPPPPAPILVPAPQPFHPPTSRVAVRPGAKKAVDEAPKPDRAVVRDPGEVVARLESVIGEVRILTAQGSRPADTGDEIVSGQGIETVGQWSQAKIQFADTTWVQFWGDTRTQEITVSRGKRLFLTKGVLLAGIAPQPDGQPMIFATPTGDAQVLGTKLRLAVESGAATLDVNEGKVRLTRREDGKSVDVAGGFTAVAAPGVELVAQPLSPEKRKPGETRTQQR